MNSTLWSAAADVIAVACRVRRWSLIPTLLAAGQAFAGVNIYPGSDIQSVVNANPPGTAYVLKAGMHRMQSITPHNNDSFTGETGTVLDGAAAVTSFIQSGSYWVAYGQNQHGNSSTSVPCQTGWDGCQYPEQLFWDNTLLQHVTSLSQLTSGKWYMDYSVGAAYVADNPAGHVVEISSTPYAFIAGASNVTIRGLVVEKYASPAQQAAIQSGSAWTVTGNELRFNHGYAISLGNSMQVTSNYIHDNGQLGLGGGGSNILVDGNEIAFNNAAHFDFTGAYGEAGGTKFCATSGLMVSNNYVHDNDGPGLWMDGSNYQWTLQGNHTTNNSEFGIMDEISYDGVIRYNIVENDGRLPDASHTSLWWGGGVMVASSSNAEIYGNTILNSTNGIGGMSTNRGSGSRGAFLLQNLYVHDNTIAQNGGTAAGIVASTDSNLYYFQAYTSWNNRFANNSYMLAPGLNAIYDWYTGGDNYLDMTSAQWIAAGEDVTATWSSAIPNIAFPTGARVALTSSSAIYSLPSYTAPSSVAGTLASGAAGSVTKVRGPVYSAGAAWWQVQFDNGPLGWVSASSLATATTITAPSTSGSGSSGSDKTSPSVGIIAPWNQTTVSGVVSICVSASDNVGVVRTELYVDGTLVATGAAAPWGFTWNTSQYSAGPHAILVLGYDAAGNKDGGAITVTVSHPLTNPAPPLVGITSPRNGAVVTGALPVSAIASGNLTIVRAELYVDGAFVAADSSAPWSFNWDTSSVIAGAHRIIVKAYDSAGNSGGAGITVHISH